MATIETSITGTATNEDCKKDHNEFIVHTKHNCDKCFQHPIIGKRYNSADNSNFDLCAHCFAVYDGPNKMDLIEAALDRDKKISHDFVLKLKIEYTGNVQIRRMKVATIWDESKSTFSISKLLTVAADFAFFGGSSSMEDIHVNNHKDHNIIDKAKVTYVDDDGDEVNVSTDDEVKDAFLLQVHTILPTRTSFVVLVTFPKVTTNMKAGILPTKEGKEGVAAAAAVVPGLPQRIPVQKIKSDKKKSLFTSQSVIDYPRCKKLLLNSMPQRITPQSNPGNPSFVHARHTCDGCFTTPIIGIRYHATKIPNFDLCESCFRRYEGGEDVDFVPETHEHDIRLQQKWSKDWGTSRRMPIPMAEFAEFLNKVQDDEPPNCGIESTPSCTVHPSESDAVFGDATKVMQAEAAKVETKSIASQTDFGNDAYAISVIHTLRNEDENHPKSSAIDDVGADVSACCDSISVVSLPSSFVSDVTDTVEEQEQQDDDDDASNGNDGWNIVDNDVPVPDNISPVELAKWDSELHQLHEMGFLDDRSNIDSLEYLEAAHIGVDSTEEVTIHQVVDHILENRVN